jgi:catechol 2,3-dioxygenase-like lactoylglutathione lyase family enzyme
MATESRLTERQGVATKKRTGKFDVGGVMLERPFKVRRLGHFGLNVTDFETSRHFYSDLLGFTISDVIARDGATLAIFTRYGGDHHAFVLLKRRDDDPPEVTINQITWQVGSLKEVTDAARWLDEQGVPLKRVGRDMPGSNWHAYISDPDGHTNELYYGIEQVGWDGRSKPVPMYERGFKQIPGLPQIGERAEVEQALANGIDIAAGYRHVESMPALYDVDGVLLPRPFKITKIGPVGLFVDDLDRAEAFYTRRMGFQKTEERQLQGRRCVFLRANTEHHSLALYPKSLRKDLGFHPGTSLMSFGVQVANYRQLRDAVAFLEANGITVHKDLPAELHPGIDYTAFAVDPDGHCIQLYYYMEQIGWDGRPRPESERRQVQPGAWPETLPPLSDTFGGEVFQGPWG